MSFLLNTLKKKTCYSKLDASYKWEISIRIYHPSFHPCYCKKKVNKRKKREQKEKPFCHHQHQPLLRAYTLAFLIPCITFLFLALAYKLYPCSRLLGAPGRSLQAFPSLSCHDSLLFQLWCSWMLQRANGFLAFQIGTVVL